MSALYAPHLRFAMEATVEALIGLLDALDGDPDLEREVDHEHDGREPEAGC